MGNLLSYSGLTTKLRAMESHLISNEDYEKISGFTSVREVVSFLRELPSYQEALADLDENNLHRGDVEKRLINSIYQGFSRIYQFADGNQRRFMDLYFQRYEVALLKRCFRMVTDHQKFTETLGSFGPFFSRHSCLNLEQMSSSGSLAELIESLKGTPYYSTMASLPENRNITLFDYEMALDMSYFARIWKQKDKILKGQDLKSITKAYGVKFDLLNLDWIFRSKKYYHLPSAEIYRMLIPMHYKLRREEVFRLAEAESMETFEMMLSKTYYAGRYQQLTSADIEDMYVAILKHTLKTEASHHPYSAAMIYSYLYQKEHEVDRLTTALECIRYQLDSELTYQYIVKN
ncbi:MAG: V-type ATPase subunit [Clostridiales bacterium]|nr:V-type ATPase subunit [Clostridiales bacterium]